MYVQTKVHLSNHVNRLNHLHLFQSVESQIFKFKIQIHLSNENQNGIWRFLLRPYLATKFYIISGQLKNLVTNIINISEYRISLSYFLFYANYMYK